MSADIPRIPLTKAKEASVQHGCPREPSANRRANNTERQHQRGKSGSPGSIVVALYQLTESHTELAAAVVEHLYKGVSRKHCYIDSTVDVDSLSSVTMKMFRFASDDWWDLWSSQQDEYEVSLRSQLQWTHLPFKYVVWMFEDKCAAIEAGAVPVLRLSQACYGSSPSPEHNSRQETSCERLSQLLV